MRYRAAAAFFAWAVGFAGPAARASASDAAANPAALADAIAGDAARVASRGERLGGEARARVASAVSKLEAERRSGRLWAALQGLREARREAAVGESRGSAESFDADWERASRDLRGRDASPPRWGSVAAAARALGEAAEGTVVPLVEASRAYAGVTNADAGTYYLADAREASDFAGFCRALPRTDRTAPAWRSIAPELSRLQERVNAAFVPPRSIDRHSDFIRLNAALKTAHELDASGRFAGAGYEYLDALEQVGLLLGAPAGSAVTVRERIEAERSALASGTRDDSLGLLFVERAESALASGGESGIAAASVIAASVVPAYRAMLEPAPMPPPAESVLTVTLVRWPYT